MESRYLREFTLRWKDAEDADGRPVPWPLDRAVNVTSYTGLLRQLVVDQHLEVFVALYVSPTDTVLGVATIAKGSSDAFTCSVAEVFRGAILANAGWVAVCHNHPCGATLPSAEDVTLTKALVAAGVALGIPFVDHVIVGPQGPAVSLRRTHPALWSTSCG